MIRRKTLPIIAGLILFFPNLTWAGTIDLPQTGQTTCYDAAGFVVPCAGTGQDGEIRAGVSWPSPRFTDNGNGSVTDNLTSLVWLREPSCFDRGTWIKALSNAKNLTDGKCGLTDGSSSGDWRLPSVNELESLINDEEPNTAEWLNGQGFRNVQAYLYWSSTSYDENTGYAWFVYMWDGLVDACDKAPHSYYTWPVRGGQ